MPPCPTSALNVSGRVLGGMLELGLERVQTPGDPGVSTLEQREKVLKQSHEKAQMLGRGAVVVEPLFAGFTRFSAFTEPEAPSAALN